MNAKEAIAKKEEKLDALLKEAEDSPIVKKLREDKAVQTLATRRETAGRIEALKNEQAATIPKLRDALAAKKADHAAAKAALDGLAEDCRAATLALMTETQFFDTALRGCEASLLETADPAITEAITIFRDRLDFLRKPGRISRNAVGVERNIFTWKKSVKEESNVEAINSAMAYCRAALAELESMKLAPALDAERIAELKAAHPRIDRYTEYSVEKPMEKINTDPRSRLKSDSQMDWEIGKLNEKFKKLMGRPA
jgi:hypothetical protein